MSIPRKRVVFAYAIYSLLEITVYMILFFGLAYLEPVLYHLAVPQAVVDLLYFWIGGVILVAVEIFGGAVWMRFSGWGIAVLWIGAMTVMQTEWDLFYGIANKVGDLSGWSAADGAVFAAGILGLILLLLGISWNIFRKQRVTS